MHTAKFFKDKKNHHIVFSYNKKNNICFNMHFGFNNKFIRVMRTKLIFQKYRKNILFCFLLVSRIMNLYVKCTPDIKKIVFYIDIKTVRFFTR